MRFAVAQNGSPVAITLAVEDHQSLMGTLKVLPDLTAIADIRDARARMDGGETFGESDIRAPRGARSP